MKSIKTKGTVFVLTILLIVLSIMLFVSHSLIKSWAMDELKSHMQETTKTIESQVEKYINLYIQPIKKLSEKPEIRSMNWLEQKDVIQQETSLEYLAIAVVDLEGLAYYTDGSTLDLSDRGYIKKSLAGEFNISPVIISRATGEPVMMIAQPITKDEEVVGTVIARIRPEFLKDFMTSGSNDMYNVYYALDKEGNVMVHSEKKFQLGRFNFLKFDEASYDFEGFKEVIRKSYQSKDGFGSYKNNNNEVIIGYSTINVVNWKFFIGFYEENLLVSLRKIDTIFLIIASLLVTVAVAIAWLISKSFTQPVIELSNLFKRASQGELTVRSTYDKSDELGEAARSFNQMMEQIKTLTYFDPITNLPNQQVFYNDLQEMIQKNNGKKNIMVIEISNFSRINQIYGYKAGDEVLKIISERILKELIIEAKLYRGKGDQFILLSEKVNGISLASEKIIKKINEPIHLKNNVITLNGRIGISESPKDGIEAESLVKKAVFASNYLKRKAIGNIQVFKSELYEEDLEIRNLVTNISKALDEDIMYLEYQPIYHLKDNRIEGIEALIRWSDPIKGNISPGEFIPIAERNGLIKKLDHWVIKAVLKQMKTWQDNGIALPVCSINISSETFESKTFEKFILETSTQEKIKSNLIQLELTERTILKDVTASIKKFKRLRSKGFKIAIDDFGVGFSSLSYLVKLPIDHLKIDRSFVMDISEGKEAKVIISTLVTMGKKLGVEVIAEGIETQEELDYLINIQCTNGQGFYLNRPLDVTSIEKILKGMN
ncbi:MAG TPA: EAL domain-containing protein [Clostridia bacterium]|nr:EAL domain-containing protein [Clostridia bacterium]